MSQVNEHWPALLHVSVPCAGAAGHGKQFADPKQPVCTVLPAHIELHTCSVAPHITPLLELEATEEPLAVVELDAFDEFVADCEEVEPLVDADACDEPDGAPPAPPLAEPPIPSSMPPP